MEIEKPELIVGGIGGVGVVALSYFGGDRLSSVYDSLLGVTRRLHLGNSFEIVVSGYKSPFKITNENMLGFVQEITKVLQVSKSIGVPTASMVIGIESATNFYRGWLGKGERPIVVDIVEGGLRGSAIGLAFGAITGETSHRAVQISTGAFVGFVTGLMSAFIGSVAGAITHNLNSKLKENV